MCLLFLEETHYFQPYKENTVKKGAGRGAGDVGFLSFSFYQCPRLDPSAEGTQTGEPGESTISCHAHFLQSDYLKD